MSKPKAERTAGQIITRLLFVLYGFLMVWLLFGQRMNNAPADLERINLQPFATLRLYVRILLKSSDGTLVRHAFVNLAGNVVMFVPLGVFLPAIWPGLKQFWRFLFCALGMIFFVEIVQYLTGLGSCDIDDVLLNLPGMLLGWSGLCIAQKKKR